MGFLYTLWLRPLRDLYNESSCGFLSDDGRHELLHTGIHPQAIKNNPRWQRTPEQVTNFRLCFVCDKTNVEWQVACTIFPLLVFCFLCFVSCVFSPDQILCVQIRNVKFPRWHSIGRFLGMEGNPAFSTIAKLFTSLFKVSATSSCLKEIQSNVTAFVSLSEKSTVLAFTVDFETTGRGWRGPNRPDGGAADSGERTMS